MNHLLLVTKREYINRVRNKAFVIMTFLSPILMLGMAALIGYLSYKNSDVERHINVLDESGLFQNELVSGSQYKYSFLDNVNLEEAKTMTEQANLYGLLYIPKAESLEKLSRKIEFYSDGTPSLSFIDNIENAIEKKINLLKIEEEGLDADYLAALRLNIDLRLESFKGEESSRFSSGLKLVFGGAAGYLLFMFIIIYGNMIMRSVIEEKSSRVIEVIVSSVSPMKLLLGKVFGTALAGITQFAIWVVLLIVLGGIGSSVFGIDTSASMTSEMTMAQTDQIAQVFQTGLTELMQLPLLNLFIMFLLFFIGGYLLYASLYAAIGAAVDNDADSQQFMMPILMPLMVAVYVGFFTVMEEPHGVISQVFSYIPLTSPVVMLMRIPFGVPIWAQMISVLLLFATFILILWVAAKIYRVGILVYGKKPSYKDMIKWLKY